MCFAWVAMGFVWIKGWLAIVFDFDLLGYLWAAKLWVALRSGEVLVCC